MLRDKPLGLTPLPLPPLPPLLQVLLENLTLEVLVLRDNPLGLTATRHLVRGMRRRLVGGALQQVGGGGGGEGVFFLRGP